MKTGDLRRGDIVEALRDFDPQGADVRRGDLGVVIADPAPLFGPLVQWLVARFVRSGRLGVALAGACNVYEGDVKRLLQHLESQ